MFYQYGGATKIRKYFTCHFFMIGIPSTGTMFLYQNGAIDWWQCSHYLNILHRLEINWARVYFNIMTVFWSMEIPIIQIRQLRNCLTFLMAAHILVGHHLYCFHNSFFTYRHNNLDWNSIKKCIISMCVRWTNFMVLHFIFIKTLNDFLILSMKSLLLFLHMCLYDITYFEASL